ncbi:MAG: sodium:solute symporter family protein, partial [Spirochaetaceae bacterium]|nr:sodium:solute symporter family protein [Spirochaetaceae bacterium]
VIVLAYLVISLALGLAARKGRPQGAGRRDFALGPGLKALPLFATMAATNFSAFTVFGLSGAGYRIGWAYYPAIGFGTGLMALSFIVLGIPLRRLAAARGYLSPSDFVSDRLGSPALGKTVSILLVALTLPYMATQAIAGGRMLEAAAGLPYWLGALLVVGVTALYTLGGGFRAVAATDALQIAILIGGAAISFATILARAGGSAELGRRLLAEAPGKLSSVGAGGSLPPLSLLGTWLLWLLADPMFPQLFQRFYAARDDRSLVRTAALYPLATGSIFFMTVGIGVAGSVLAPGLAGTETEQVFTRLAWARGDDVLATVFILAALAALMSTMDSQLLTLSTMVVQDFAPRKLRKKGSAAAVIGALALAAWVAALRPPKLILDWLTGIAFPGYALLAPIMVYALFSGRSAANAAAALGVGLAALALETAGAIRIAPIPQSLFNLCLQIAVLTAGVLVARSRTRGSAAKGTVPTGADDRGQAIRLGEFARPAWI